MTFQKLKQHNYIDAYTNLIIIINNNNYTVIIIFMALYIIKHKSCILL